MNELITRKTSFLARFKKRYRLRLHMSLLLLATVCSGLLATRVMLAMHLKNVAVRYPLAVAFAYLVFFLWLKLWLKFVAPAPASQSGDGIGNINIIPGSSSGSSGGSASGGFKGGGGDFGGAGASGSFEVAETPVSGGVQVVAAGLDAGSGAAEAAGEAGTDAAGGLGGLAGDAVSSIDDEKGCLIALVLLAVAAVVFGAGLFLVYQAPLILSEAAFQAILAGGLARGAKRLEEGDWLGSVFKATWKPFALTLVLAIIAGFCIHHYFPGVTRISELFRHR